MSIFIKLWWSFICQGERLVKILHICLRHSSFFVFLHLAELFIAYRKWTRAGERIIRRSKAWMWETVRACNTRNRVKMTNESIYGSIAIYAVGLFLNLLEIVLLLHLRRTKQPFDLTLISLASANLYVSFIPIPAYVTMLAGVPSNVRVFAVLVEFTHNTACMTSAFHLGFIAFQRLVAVRYPHQSSIWLTRKCCIITICFLWFTSLLMHLPFCFFNYTQVFSIALLFVGVAILFSYSALNYQLFSSKRISRSGISSNQNIHILIYSTMVTAVFLLSTFPLNISIIISSHAPLYAIYLYKTRVISDPLLYFLYHYLKRKDSNAQVRVPMDVRKVRQSNDQQ